VTWRTFGQSFVTLLVILDPLGGVPVFLGLTRSLDPRARDHAAYTSVLAASGVLAVFAAFGQVILQYLSISLESLMVAGGCCCSWSRWRCCAAAGR
jgi:small neutral amino acid transporter SnatA (MarC family)